MNTLAPPLAKVASPETAIDEALGRIPPLWPLGRFVAVNPFSGLSHLPFADACALLDRTSGRAPLQALEEYLAAYESGEISQEDLASVTDAEWPEKRLVRILKQAAGEPRANPLATVADLLDRNLPHARWSGFVAEEISKWCGVTFDENQTTWNSPWKSLGLYQGWREAASGDRNPEVFGLRKFRSFVSSLPDDAGSCISRCMEILAPRHADAADFFHRQLDTISGWAGYVQFRVREERLRGGQSNTLRDLLAIRLAYDTALFQTFVVDGDLLTLWRNQPAAGNDPLLLAALVRWQVAYEAGYQKKLIQLLEIPSAAEPETRPPAQAVFCIDVRSEVLRRHLETAMPGLRTVGFAGFFGFPVNHADGVSECKSARCPVLLAPPVASEETIGPREKESARIRYLRSGAWKAFQNSAISCFSFVESAGLAFSLALGGIRGNPASAKNPAPRLVGVPLKTRADLAEGALRNMGLVRNFARIVLICGHRSGSANNPYASSLECGACGGHAGDVNARLAAATLNDREVRLELADRGVPVPDDTVFVAGLHRTISDDVELFDLSELPSSHTAELAALRSALATAGAFSRQERAAACGVAGLEPEALAPAFRARSVDISQTRPEWGLANNAAFVAAPRRRTSGLRLDGRVFLHDYDAAADPDRKVLSLILTAPVVVASWINLQYYASRVDPLRHGSGDKALHHVIGGIGVTEGNGGDIRTGLPFQSIHDGTRFMHEARRLTVVIETTRAALDSVLAAHDPLRQLFENGWILLIALEGACGFRRTPEGGWESFTDPQIPHGRSAAV